MAKHNLEKRGHKHILPVAGIIFFTSLAGGAGIKTDLYHSLQLGPVTFGIAPDNTITIDYRGPCIPEELSKRWGVASYSSHGYDGGRLWRFVTFPEGNINKMNDSGMVIYPCKKNF